MQKSSPLRNWRESTMNFSTSNFRDCHENAAKPPQSRRSPSKSPERDWSFLDDESPLTIKSSRLSLTKSANQSDFKPLLPNLSKTLKIDPDQPEFSLGASAPSRPKRKAAAAASHIVVITSSCSEDEEPKGAASRKRKRGRPAGSKNKPKCFVCKVCEVEDEEPLVIIQACGDIIHRKCMTQALESNEEVCEYFKTCPVCKAKFHQFYPFFG
ncbi:uncharacterized protein LOC127751336 [Frankliniella occidentalis]|uniref:Uncharacterized protein LOC127751336 n=1 Tax=Frankliniella occidentalis TaxID=133901 RepID=A0A9C6X7Y3_FRAOC|nr:uncharacterized protein LOC127751336 [Frankliniella occidentalis]